MGRTATRGAACVALLGMIVGSVAQSQQPRTVQQEGAQQGYENAAPAQRADATRVFLGLGAVPDKAAVARGGLLFAQNCAFCHGDKARGATGPSLITSDQVLADNHGEHLAAFLRRGIPEKGMPAFASMPDQQLIDIAEFLHQQVEDVANRGAYHVLNIVVGNAAAGKVYVESHCMQCHSAETFAHFASKFRSAEQLQRDWIWPRQSAHMTARVKTAEGTVTGQVTQISDFRISLVDAAGKAIVIDRKPSVEVSIDDPLAAHQDMVMTLANDAMHNVTAYLETLK